MILFRITPFILEDRIILSCTDGITDKDRADWLNKIAFLKDRIAYYKEDADNNYNNMLVTEQDKHNFSEEEYTAQMKRDEQGYGESSTNVHSDEKRIN